MENKWMTVSSAYKMLHVGSNNVNLLQPIGQFGTRLNGGKDAASPRWGERMLHDVFLFYLLLYTSFKRNDKKDIKVACNPWSTSLNGYCFLLCQGKSVLYTSIKNDATKGPIKQLGWKKLADTPPCSTTSITTFAGNLLAVGIHIIHWPNDGFHGKMI